MYVIATVFFQGDDSEYEVGADVEYYSRDYCGDGYYEVGEPDIGAPDCKLKLSRLVSTDDLPEGWSQVVEEALIEAYRGACEGAEDAAADFAYDMWKESCLDV
jgi:hypothetical protein